MDAGDNPDKVLDGQTLVGCDERGGGRDGGEGAEGGNGVPDGRRGAKVDDVAVVVVGAEVVVDDDDATVAAAPAAGLADADADVVVGAAAVVYAWRAPRRGNPEGGQLRSLWSEGKDPVD